MRKVLAFVLISVVWSTVSLFAQVNPMDLESAEVNAFDRLAMLPYSKSLDVVGTAFELASVLTPAVLLSVPANEWLPIGIMYVETMLVAYGLKELGKLCIHRFRPYLYFDSYPQHAVDDGDAADSFPSGHATMAFAGAAFASSVYAAYYPDSSWKVPVTVASYTLASVAAILRVASGNHFMTDVLAGALIGTAVGIGIPWLHKRVGTSSITSSVSPFSLAFGIAW